MAARSLRHLEAPARKPRRRKVQAPDAACRPIELRYDPIPYAAQAIAQAMKSPPPKDPLKSEKKPDPAPVDPAPQPLPVFPPQPQPGPVVPPAAEPMPVPPGPPADTVPAPPTRPLPPGAATSPGDLAPGGSGTPPPVYPSPPDGGAANDAYVEKKKLEPVVDKALAAADDDDSEEARAFADDIQAILSAAKPDDTGRAADGFLDRARRDAVQAGGAHEEEPAPREEEASALSEEDDEDSPVSNLGHAFFDRLTFANQFDAGEYAVDLGERFDAFDDEIQQEHEARRRPGPKLEGPSAMDVLEDLTHIESAAFGKRGDKRAVRGDREDRPDDEPEAADRKPAAGTRPDEELEVVDSKPRNETAPEKPEPPAARAPAPPGPAALAPPPASAAPAVDVRFEVPLIPQLPGYSCWAAAAAMIAAWRDPIPQADPAGLAAGSPPWAAYAAGREAADPSILPTWRLAAEPVRSYSVDELRTTLDRYGPLLVGAATPGVHVRVVAAMSGDGTAQGTTVHVLDPWERGRSEFAMPNAGGRYAETFADFMTSQASAGAGATAGIYVAHADHERPRPDPRRTP